MATYQQIVEYLKVAEASKYSNEDVKARFEAEPATSYGSNMAQWIPDFAYAHQLFIDSLALHVRGNGQVLELGAGSGRVSQLILEALPDAHLTAVDISANMLGMAEQRLHREAQRCRFMVQNMFDEHLDFQDASFDGVATVFALCHGRGSETYQRLYERIFRWLKTPGYFVCYDHVAGDTLALTALNALGWHQLLMSTQSAAQARDGVISTYQEDAPLSLREHLTLLSSAGFTATDVLYKRDIFAIYAGVK